MLPVKWEITGARAGGRHGAGSPANASPEIRRNKRVQRQSEEYRVNPARCPFWKWMLPGNEATINGRQAYFPPSPLWLPVRAICHLLREGTLSHQLHLWGTKNAASNGSLVEKRITDRNNASRPKNVNQEDRRHLLRVILQHANTLVLFFEQILNGGQMHSSHFEFGCPLAWFFILAEQIGWRDVTAGVTQASVGRPL